MRQAWRTEPTPREGGQEGGCEKDRMSERKCKESSMSRQGAKQGSSTPAAAPWVDSSIWTDRMLAALVNGVKGNKWFSLIDKVYNRNTLERAWQKVRRNRGAAGVDGQSTDRFAVRAEAYLDELSAALKAGLYRPEAIP